MTPLLSQTASAETQDIKRVRIQRGHSAPFSGILLTDAAMAKIITDYESQLKTLELDIVKLNREFLAETQLNKKITEASIEAEKMKAKILEDSLISERNLYKNAIQKNGEHQPWYKQPYIHFLLGSALSGSLFYAASQVN